MKKTKTIIVPVFPGFYNTIYEFNHDTFDSNLNWELECISDVPPIPDGIIDELANKVDVYDVNIYKYEDDIGESFCEVLTEHFRDLFNFETFKINFKEIDRPSFYNFKNDKIIAEVEYTDEEATVLEDFVEEHIDDWSEYLKDHFTSCDGFISFYSNDYTEWPTYFDSMDEVESQYFLSFILKKKCDRSDLGETLYYSTTDNIYSGEYISLKDSLITVLQSDVMKKEFESFEDEWDKCREYIVLMSKQNPEKDYATELNKKRNREIDRIVDKIKDMMESL